jgi:muramoyltetrapeptide carboxypeptidase
MIIPSFLQPGDTIAITCPSGYVPIERVQPAIAVLEQWGYTVVLGNTVGNEHGYFSGTDSERRQDLQSFLDDRSIKAILMGRGGYGLSRIIDDLDFSTFIKYPKWIAGFSDITVLHSHIQANYQIATLHSPMSGAFATDNNEAPYLLSLKTALAGDDPIDYPIHPSSYNRMGVAQGIVTGGNLAMLAHLTGSTSQIDTRGKILFLEDVGEYLYNIDRMLLNLKRAGTFEHINGLICGGFTDVQDTTRPFGQDIYHIILDKVKEYTFPVCFDFPAGHQEINYTLRLGQPHTLTVAEDSATLTLNHTSQI